MNRFVSLSTKLRSVFALSLVTIAWLCAPAAAATVCSTVAIDGQTPPDSTLANPLKLSKAFDNEVGVNASGDVLFVGQPANATDRVYLYPAGNVLGGEAVARGLGPAPNGKSFKAGGAFKNVSINDFEDLAFSGAFSTGGQGVFVRRFGSSLETAADTGSAGPSPLTGTITSLPAVSLINANGQVAFVALTDAGEQAVLLYDATTNVLSTVMVSGDAISSPAGRKVCDLLAVGLRNNTTDVVVRGTTAAAADSCSDTGATVGAIFYTSGPNIIEAVKEGDSSPVAGTTFTAFGDGSVDFLARNVFMNASGKLSFRASIAGSGVSTSGLFRYDAAGPTITKLAALKDAAPAPIGGVFYGSFIYQLANTDEAIFDILVSGGSTKEGIFAGDGTTTTSIVTLQGPFAPGLSKYGNFFVMGSDVDATHVVFRTSATDTDAKSRVAVVSCGF